MAQGKKGTTKGSADQWGLRAAQAQAELDHCVVDLVRIEDALHRRDMSGARRMCESAAMRLRLIHASVSLATTKTS